MNQTQLKNFNQLSTQQLYSIISLRLEVFCVEQDCAYQDVDGLDVGCLHVFVEDETQVIAYARILNIENDNKSIGRVVVAKSARNAGLATKIMQSCIEYCKSEKKSIIISAQSYLTDFYQSLGFESLKEFYLEDDIPHEKMIYRI